MIILIKRSKLFNKKQIRSFKINKKLLNRNFIVKDLIAKKNRWIIGLTILKNLQILNNYQI